MNWPIDDLTTNHLDSSGDDPSQARPEILAAINKLKELLEVVGGSTVEHGRLNADGTAERLPAGWSSVRTGTGKYRITHTLGNANFTVTAIVNGTHRNVFTVSPGATYIYLYVLSIDAGPSITYVDEKVHFMVAVD